METVVKSPQNQRISVKNEPYALFTGGTGFLGLFLAGELLRRGRKVLFLVRPGRKKDIRQFMEQALNVIGGEGIPPERWSYIEGDVLDPPQALSSLPLTELWHAAASLSFLEENRELTMRTNIEGTRHMVRLAHDRRLPLAYLSTAYVCGDTAQQTVKEGDLDCGVQFRNPYEESKCKAELLVRSAIDEGRIRGAIFRPSIIIGHSKSAVATRFFGYYAVAKFLLRRSGKRLPLLIPYCRGGVSNVLPVDYACELIADLWERPEAMGKTFHIVNPQAPTIDFLLQSARKVLPLSHIHFLTLPRGAFLIISRLARATLLRIRAFRALKQYLPYLAGDPVFDTTNVAAVLHRQIEPPLLDEALFERYFAYAQSHNFHHVVE